MLTMKVERRFRRVFSRLLLTALSAAGFAIPSASTLGQVPGIAPPGAGGNAAAAQAPPAEAPYTPPIGPGSGGDHPVRGKKPPATGTTGAAAFPGGMGMGPGTTSGSSDFPPAAELIGMALQGNPDLQVARAKVAEAEAELRRVQHEVARQVLRHRNEYESLKSKVARLQKLHAAKSATAEELSEAVTELTAVETELNYLLGRSLQLPGGLMPGGSGLPGMMPGMMGMSMMPGASGMDSMRMMGGPGTAGGGGMPGMSPNSKAGMKSVMRGPSGVPGLGGFPGAGNGPTVLHEGNAKKLARSLESVLDLKMKDVPLEDVIQRLGKEGEVKFVIDTARLAHAGVPLDMPVSFVAGPTTFAAALQMIEDLHPPVRFVVRDYGILVTDGENPPAGAVIVRDFLKHRSESEKGDEAGGRSEPKESTKTR